MNYIISSNQIGSGSVGKVFKIQTKEHPYKYKIIKIFEEQGYDLYIREKNILLDLSNNNPNDNDYIIKISNEQVILDFMDNFPLNSTYLLFDYLKHGNLNEYLYNMEKYTPFSENFVKVIGYKLLKGLKKIHDNKICHNKIQLKNIMFDDDFNPIIIHFNEATRNNTNYRKDFFGFAEVLGQLMTSGKMLNIKYEQKHFVIIDNFHRKIKDKTFWTLNKNISPEFIKLFDLLIKSKKPLIIDDLLNNEWFNGIKNNDDNVRKIEDDLKKYLNSIYEDILLLNQIKMPNIDINSILNSQNSNSYEKSLINLGSLNSDRSLEYIEEDNYYNLGIKTINFEPEGILFNYIEINFSNNRYDDEDNNTNILLIDFMKDLEKLIKKNIEKNIYSIEWDKEHLSFDVNFKENIIYDDNLANCDKYSEEDECNECIQNNNEDNDSRNDEIFEDNDDEPLILKVQLFKYIGEQNCESSKEKYYLMFNYTQGEIHNYHYFMNIIKEKAKSLLLNINKNKND
jgi:serine/threonine protein kinase